MNRAELTKVIFHMNSYARLLHSKPQTGWTSTDKEDFKSQMNSVEDSIVRVTKCRDETPNEVPLVPTGFVPRVENQTRIIENLSSRIENLENILAHASEMAEKIRRL